MIFKWKLGVLRVLTVSVKVLDSISYFLVSTCIVSYNKLIIIIIIIIMIIIITIIIIIIYYNKFTMCRLPQNIQSCKHVLI